VLKVLMATACAAFVAIPAAGAAKPGPPPGLVWAPGIEVSYTETMRDGLGNVIAQIHRDGIPAGKLFGSAATTGAATTGDMPSQRRLAGRRGCCSSSGSDTVDFTVTKRTLLGNVAWRFHQVDHWCWSYPSITCLSVGSGFYDVDGQQSVNYDDHGTGWYYSWSGAGTGGHYAERQGSVSNCIFRWGCISTSYPQVKIWLNGNGAWTGSGSD
jgi:hypothetical protein